ncbi:NXPE family member 3-like [Branchiostoma lanceolatum]|uniref:NXPE family member 3-like n=1 Tax=Branchiostoma lanceolatum TaxID=7740 RepID=UPI003451146B
MSGQATVCQKGAGVLLFFGFLATCVYYYTTDRLQSSTEPFQDRWAFLDDNGGLRQINGFPPKTLLDDYVSVNKTPAPDGIVGRNEFISKKGNVTQKPKDSNKVIHNVSTTASFTKLVPRPRSRVFSDLKENVTNKKSTQIPVSELHQTEKPPETPEQTIVEIAGLPTVYEPTEYPEHIVVRLNATFEGNISTVNPHTVDDITKTTERPKTTSVNKIQQNTQLSTDLFDVLTSASTSKLELLTKGPIYHLGDSLHVRIQARDWRNRPKTRGGDYFKAKIFNPSLLASSAGRVTDHGDGTYTVSFWLSWSGETRVEVTLIHPAETIDVLKRIRPTSRKRVYACSFTDGNHTIQTQCFPSPNPDPSQRECNFSSAHARAGWYCGQPGDIPCDKVVGCGGIGLRDHEYLGITEEEVRLFNETYIDQVVSGSFSINVTANNVPCVIRHSGGKCLHVKTYPGEEQPINRLVLKDCGNRQRQLFVHWPNGRLMHAVSKKCLVLNTKGEIQEGTEITLGDCDENSLHVIHTPTRTLQDMSTGMCLHPYGGSSLPEEDTHIVIFSGCEEYRLMFEYMEDPSTLPKCVPSSESARPDSDGFFLQDKWYSRYCNARRFPDAESVAQCLSGESLIIQGDSTARQWFEHLHMKLDIKPIRLAPDLDSCRLGPCAVHNNLTDFHMHFQFHNFPVHGNPFKVHNMEYIVDALDRLEGGPRVTFVINIWAHFTPEPVEVYRSRILAIRDAILRLHQRSQDTLVVVKSANIALSSFPPDRRPIKPDLYLQADDWYAEDFNNLMRDVFAETKAVFLDVWEMTSCHRSPHDIHPTWGLVSEEVDLMLAYICPDRTL